MSIITLTIQCPDQKQDEIKHLQTLDENDLVLAHDFNKIFNE